MLAKFLNFFKKDYNRPYYNFIINSPCGLSNLQKRKVSEADLNWGDDEWYQICFNASKKEYECFKKHINALTPKEFYALDDSDEEKYDFFWLVDPKEFDHEDTDVESDFIEDMSDYKDLTLKELHENSIKFTDTEARWHCYSLSDSISVAFVKGSEVNSYTFICFNGRRIWYYSFYS